MQVQRQELHLPVEHGNSLAVRRPKIAVLLFRK